MSSTTKKYKIVGLDSWVPLPDNLAIPHTTIQYPSTTPQQLPERVKDADIIIISGTPMTRAGIESAPNLKLIACNSTGTDHVDKQAAAERGVAVCRVPARNTDSVSEHAFALYFAVRRRVVKMHEFAMDGGRWGKESPLSSLGRPPRTNSEEALVVVGYGALGQTVEKIGKALGMTVLIAERKGASEPRAGRTAFADAIKQGTVFIVVAPLDDSTRDMISTPELTAMDPTAIVINAGRGGVINEAALATALKEGLIGGAATDVYEHEPANQKNCPLLDPSIPNLILSPHVAWYSSKTIKGTLETVKENIEGFVNGIPQNIVVPASGSKL